MSVISWQFLALVIATAVVLRLSTVVARRYVLVAASLIFYAGAGPISLAVVLLLIGANFAILRAMLQTPSEAARDRIFLASILFNLTVFVALKSAFEPALDAGFNLSLFGLPLAYPVGLSFIILMLHSAVADAHSGRYIPCGRLSTFTLFGLFFPYVSAGPVERLERMEQAFDSPPRPSGHDLREGLALIALGLVKKLVVANRFKPYIDHVFNEAGVHSVPTLVFALVLNLLYIYVEFSGYTDIARGAARCFGVQVSINFDRPMGSRSVTEFWRRWHISFSSWLRDYVYMPLAFILRRRGRVGLVAALLTTFVVCGFWHRLNWNFLIFGVAHGLAIVGEMTFAHPEPGADRPVARALHRAGAHTYTLSFLALTLVLFSTANLSQAGHLLARLFTDSPVPHLAEATDRGTLLFGLMVAAAAIWQGLERWRSRLDAAKTPFFLAACALIVLFLGLPDGEGFVYAQF